MARTTPARLTTTPWDMFLFVLTYIVAVFMTIVTAETCNTTTISLFVTVTDLISLANASTVTVTQFGPALDGTSTILSADTTGTLTVTELTTITASSEIGSQATADSSLTSTMTVISTTTLALSSVTSTLPAPGVSGTLRPSGTRVSVPETITLTFPTVTLGTSCASGQHCVADTGAPVPTSNMTSTYTMTVTESVHLDATPLNPSPSWGAPNVDVSSPPFVNTTIETSARFSIPPPTSTLSVASSIIVSLTAEHSGTETIWAWTTVTLLSNDAVISPVEPVSSILSEASSLLGDASSAIGTRTQSTTVTDIASVLSEASSALGDASSVIATRTESTTVTDIATVLSAAASHLSVASSELATKTSAAGAGTFTVTVFITISETLSAVVKPTGLAVNVTLPALETQAIQPDVLTLTSVVAPNYTNSTSTTTAFSTIPTIAPSNETTTVIVSTIVTAGVSDVTTAPSSATADNTGIATITSKVTSYVSSNGTVSETRSVSTALPLFNGTLTGPASSLRIPPIFSLFSMLLNMKEILVNAAIDSGIPPFSDDPSTTHSADRVVPVKRAELPTLPLVSSVIPFPDLSSSPISSVPAHPAAVSISVSVSTTTELCNCTAMHNPTDISTFVPANTTITLPTTILETLITFSTLTTSVAGAVPQANSSIFSATSFPVLNTTSNSSLAWSTHSSPAFGSLVNSTTTTASLHVTTAHPTTTVTQTTTAATVAPSSDVGRVEVTVGLLILVAMGAWFVL
ncbi:hypothetical protein PV04_06987 [Phialophora macrospora]|uniref:Uncharacterized protein n=1 Tax=Phialophora macrospora TaxID=1851006 RepID=A0A0D2CRG8_9EURO|nr:hypothetical protein PV04_06987 [Phialophora macrospora]